MGNFLDKVGLQHFVEKVKNLLSGYLPLSGGTMTGEITYGDTVTFGKLGLQFRSSDSSSEQSMKVSDDGIIVNYRGSHPTYGSMQMGHVGLDINGLNLLVASAKGGTATFNVNEGTTKKFVLSRDSSSEGLIANNSETVVKELSARDVLDILRDDSASFITSKHYLSETGLSAVSQAMYNKISKTIIQTNADNVIYPGYINHINIPAYTNVCINTASWSIDDPECITFMRCEGFVDITNFLGLRDIHTFDARHSKLLNKSLDSLFEDCEHLNIVEISDWNIDIVTSCSSMFKGCTAITSIFLDMWDTRNITDTSYMFYNCSRIDTISLDGWNTQSVKTMANMFTACSQLTDLTLGPGFGRMKDSVGTLDLSALTKWTTYSVQTLLDLYDRKANGMGVITIKLSADTKTTLGTSGIQTLTAKGYTIA